MDGKGISEVESSFQAWDLVSKSSEVKCRRLNSNKHRPREFRADREPRLSSSGPKQGEMVGEEQFVRG